MLNHRIYHNNYGKLYQVITTALYAEKNEEYVVYQELHSLYKIYTMPFNLFHQNFKEYVIDNNNPDERQNFIDKPSDKNNLIDKNNPLDKNKAADKKINLPADDLMNFLDARTIREKIEILSNIKGNINEHMINSIEISLDMPAGYGDIDSRIEAVKRTLQTHERYEGKRLR